MNNSLLKLQFSSPLALVTNSFDLYTVQPKTQSRLIRTLYPLQPLLMELSSLSQSYAYFQSLYCLSQELFSGKGKGKKVMSQIKQQHSFNFFENYTARQWFTYGSRVPRVSQGGMEGGGGGGLPISRMYIDKI